jgi:hypothetical protein
LSFFYGFPLWVDATWAIAVWFSVAGSLLILLRSRYAALVLGISLLAMIATSIHNFLLSDIKMQEVVGAEGALFHCGDIYCGFGIVDSCDADGRARSVVLMPGYANSIVSQLGNVIQDSPHSCG